MKTPSIVIAALLLTTKVSFSSPAVINYNLHRNERADDSYSNYSPTTSSQSGPYPPSGWTPSGDLLLVPGETHSNSQQNSYGPPPPFNQYGPAESTTEKTTTTTTEPPNQEPAASEGDSQESPEPPGENGQYYVLLSDGKLQRVQYKGKQSGRGQYEAQVQYEEVEPVRHPLFSYQNFPVPVPF